jgi:very-short-patch-repair endonuclease
MKELPKKIWTPPRSSPGAVSRARELRKEMTHAESLLWIELRDRRFKEHKFRRQHPIGKYIVDFFSFSAKLAIELDGGIHNERVEEDNWRQAVIQTRGIRFLRFRNEEIEQNMQTVLDRIGEALLSIKT